MKEKTVGEVYNEFTEEQKKVVEVLIFKALGTARGGRPGCIKKQDRDAFDDFTDEQKKVVYFLVGMAIEDRNTYNKLKELYSKIGD